VQQQIPAGSSAAAGLAAPASKRRKTANPKHRPTSSEQQHDSRGPQATSNIREPPAPATTATATATAAAAPRDKTPTNRARASPRNDRTGVSTEGAPGGSNPPMSPVAGILGKQRALPLQ
jgi:hypothetical protein